MTLDELQQIVAEAKKAMDENLPWVAVERYADILAQTDPQTTSAEIKELRLIALKERSHFFDLLGEYETVLSVSEQYLHEIEDDHQRVGALRVRAKALRHTGRYSEARQYYEKSLKLAQTIKDTLGCADAYWGLGIYHHLMGYEEESQISFQQAYNLYKDVGHVPGQINSLISIALAQSYNEIDKAIAMYNEAMKLARELGQLDHVITILNNLGECYQDLFDMEQALVIHQEALAMAEQIHLRGIQADLYRNIGVELFSLGHTEMAIPNLDLALQISHEINDVDVEAQTLYSLSLAELAQDHCVKAEEYALTLQNLADQQNSNRYRARAFYALGWVKQKQGDPNAAAEQWQQALFLSQLTHQQILMWQIHASLAEVSTVPGLKTVHWHIAAQIIQQIAQPIQNVELKQRFLAAAPIASILASVS